MVPGLYPSINTRWARRLGCEGSPYPCLLNPFIVKAKADYAPHELLASFMGASKGKPVHEKMAKVAHRFNWADIDFADTGRQFIKSIQTGDIDTHLALKPWFAVDLRRSKFIPCPAGSGPSSFRILESMKSARAPVVIADTWTSPVGPDWDALLIRVSEYDIHRLPDILLQKSNEWEAERRGGGGSDGADLIRR